MVEIHIRTDIVGLLVYLGNDKTLELIARHSAEQNPKFTPKSELQLPILRRNLAPYYQILRQNQAV
ncbi:MAG: hypothetical protein IKJ98_01760 [Bacteroidales bacterium]|nr:hypothetical protein [Bacteroidales bacterium]